MALETAVLSLDKILLPEAFHNSFSTCQRWQKEPDRFTINRRCHTVGLNI